MGGVLLAGESWVTQATHYKGFDSFTSVTFHSGADEFLAGLRRQGIEVEHLYAHDVPDRFPGDRDSLAAYDVIILSDIGANSFLLPQDTWLHGRSRTNRLALLADWVRAGGGLMMAGGYLSFQGFQARANFARSPIAEVLPVAMSDYDDRVEAPQGIHPAIADPDHPIGRAWRPNPPAILGYNRVAVKPGTRVVATVGEDVLIAAAEHGAGRAAVWTSDIGPHWCPVELSRWEGFEPVMAAIVRWLRREI
ncbi:MAG: glutamine amidotransferase [Chloroflexi bacterium]|nr:glutamine amidotransferase [Chloroflexota bacterium]